MQSRIPIGDDWDPELPIRSERIQVVAMLGPGVPLSVPIYRSVPSALRQDRAWWATVSAMYGTAIVLRIRAQARSIAREKADMMATIDLDTLRARIRSMDFEPGTPEQVALWCEDFAESRANLAIEDMPLDAEDDAMFAIMLDEDVSPAMMVTLIHGLYQPRANQFAA